MTDREDRFEAVDSSEAWVLSDLADIFLLGPKGDRPAKSLFCSMFLRLGEYWADFISVGVPSRDRGAVMKPYRSTLAPSTSSQSSRPPASSVSRL